MRSFTDWLEDILGKEPSEPVIVDRAERTKDRIIEWKCGFGSGFAMPALVHWLHWHPAWVFLLIIAPAAIAVHYLLGRLAKWYFCAATLTAGTIVLALLPS